MIQVAFLGPNHVGWKLPDMNLREGAIMATMIAVVLWFGLYPQSILATARQSITNLQQIVATTRPEEKTQAPVDPLNVVLPEEWEAP